MLAFEGWRKRGNEGAREKEGSERERQAVTAGGEDFLDLKFRSRVYRPSFKEG